MFEAGDVFTPRAATTPADFGVQRSQVHPRAGLRASTENIGSPAKQLPLPFDDLGRVQLEFLAQLIRPLVLAQGDQSDPRLEHRTESAPCAPR